MNLYIKAINMTNNAENLEKYFENNFHGIRAFYMRNTTFAASLILKDYADYLIGEYMLTNYDCVQKHRPFDEIKSEIKVTLDQVRKTYIQFMNKTFSDYKSNYLEDRNKSVLEDMGELNPQN